MFVVRYVALVALAIWVGGMVTPFWPDTSPAPVPPLSWRLAYPCGATLLISLFVLKFVGPPPRAFPFRAGLVVLMLAIVAWTHARTIVSPVPTVFNIVIGLTLMSWYARE